MNTHQEFRNPFLSVDQVAERYGVSTDSIWRWKREGKFPAPVRVGSGITRWRLADLIEHESTLQACCMMSLGWLDAA
ncbi:MAG TPA: AlpA family phage regulatory protein [Paracoccus sp.]|nr:AlpA family phage regulatory protein [Paracoccus sp. (in: a-proteobacteria)]